MSKTILSLSSDFENELRRAISGETPATSKKIFDVLQKTKKMIETAPDWAGNPFLFEGVDSLFRKCSDAAKNPDDPAWLYCKCAYALSHSMFKIVEDKGRENRVSDDRETCQTRSILIARQNTGILLKLEAFGLSEWPVYDMRDVFEDASRAAVWESSRGDEKRPGFTSGGGVLASFGR